MLDINFIRNNQKLVEEGARKKGFKINIGELLEVDKKRRKLKQEVDELRRRKNVLSEKIAQRTATAEAQNTHETGGSRPAPTVGADPCVRPSSDVGATRGSPAREAPAGERQKLLEESTKIKERLTKVEDKFRATRKKWRRLMLQVPNVPDPEVPVGEGEDSNRPVRKWGRKPTFDFKPKDHLELGQSLDIIDFKRGVKVSGNNFYYLKNEAASLQWALMSFAIDKVRERGFSLMIVPDLVKKKAMLGTGFLPAEEREIYELKKDGLYLIGTAEVPLGAYRAGEILDKQDLPCKYAGFSACFRREAGAYGKKSKGIYRAHQFHKVEMFVICHPDDAEGIFEDILGVSEEVVQEINLPYRVVFNCTGDMGFPQRKKYDIETWMPGRGEYGETHSCSNDTDFQARRLGIRFRKDGETKFVYTLNNTVVAERLIVAILENYQREDGSVAVPEVLQSYCGFKEITK